MTKPSVEHELPLRTRQRSGLIRILVFAAIFLPILISLGFWQLGRAQEKEKLLQALAVREQQPPLQSAELDLFREEWRHRYVELVGQYEPEHQWLLENRIHQGKPGYEVITVFRTESDQQRFLVNRGWVEGSPLRKDIPELPVPEGQQRLIGQLDAPRYNPLVLKELPPDQDWPKRVQRLELDALIADLQRPLAPWLVRLQNDQPGVLIPAHKPVTMGPNKHRGYAVQWFGLAIVLVMGVIAVIVQMRKKPA